MSNKTQNLATFSAADNPPAYNIHDFDLERASSSQHQEDSRALSRSTLKEGFQSILRRVRNGPPHPPIPRQDVHVAVSSAFAARPRPLTRREVTTAVTAALNSHPRPLTRRAVTNAMVMALASRPAPLSKNDITAAVTAALVPAVEPLTKDEITAAVTTALVPAVAPLTKDEITSAVTDAFAPTVELATLRERVKWMALDRERLQQELKEAKAEIADWKEKSPRGWKPYGIGLKQSGKEEGQSERSVSG